MSALFLVTICISCLCQMTVLYLLLILHRYLAVRLGLNVAVVKDVFGQHERTALDCVQPASLTQHYKFATHSRHLSDACLEDADLVRILLLTMCKQECSYFALDIQPMAQAAREHQAHLACCTKGQVAVQNGHQWQQRQSLPISKSSASPA